jgi:hypothetical protein
MSHFGTSKAIFLRELTHLVPRVDGYRRGCLWPGYGTNAGRWHRVTVTEYARTRFDVIARVNIITSKGPGRFQAGEAETWELSCLAHELNAQLAVAVFSWCTARDSGSVELLNAPWPATSAPLASPFKSTPFRTNYVWTKRAWKKVKKMNQKQAIYGRFPRR